jgi:hypothetical protein
MARAIPTIPTWAPYALLGVGVATATGLVVSALLPDVKPTRCDWRDPTAPHWIREITKPIERMTNLKGLGDFFAAVAWIESRGDPRAGSDQGNAARGLLGMRPVSARVSDLGLPPSALKDARTSIALGAWYLHRCLKYAAPGQRIDWLSIRRCWKYPSLTDDEDDTSVQPNLAKGLYCSGTDPDFMFKKAIRWNYDWPGVDAVLAAVGRSR